MTKLLTAAIRSEQIKEYKSVGEAWKASSQNPEDIATKFSVSGDCIRYWCHRHQEAIKLLTATGNHSDLNSPLNAIESITTTSKCSCYTYDIWHLLMGSTSTKEALTIIQDQGSTVRQQLRTKSVMPRVILISNVICHHKSIIDHLSNDRIHKYSAAADNNCQLSWETKLPEVQKG